MDTDEDVRERIDRSFGDGPAPAPVTDLLGHGHRALARRRLTVAAAAAAAVVGVVGGGAALAGGTGDDARAPQVATSATPTPPTPSASPGATQAARPTDDEIAQALRRPLAGYDDPGRLTIDPAAKVLTRIDDPYRGGTIDRSVALELSFRGATYWIAQYHVKDGSSGGTADYGGDQDERFEQWVQEQNPGEDVGSSVGPDVWPGTVDADLVRFSGGGSERLVATSGARIVAQRPHVSVGQSFEGPGDRTAAAEVVSADGIHLYVLARSFDGKPGQYIYVTKQQGGRDLAGFLELARHRYASGGGGLL